MVIVHVDGDKYDHHPHQISIITVPSLLTIIIELTATKIIILSTRSTTETRITTINSYRQCHLLKLKSRRQFPKVV